MTLDRKKMGDLHEEYLAGLTGGRQTRGSGNQWRDQGDTHDNHLLTDPAFSFDGKSTRQDSITITRAMITKITEQAGGERPGLGLRWYDTDRLDRVGFDWVAITGQDFSELLTLAREHPALLQQLREGTAALTEMARSDALSQLEAFETWVRGQTDAELSAFFLAMKPELKARLINVLTPGDWPSIRFASPEEMRPGTVSEEEAARFAQDLEQALASSKPLVQVAVEGPDPAGLERQLAAAQAEIEMLRNLITHPAMGNTPMLNSTSVHAVRTSAEPPVIFQGIHITPSGQRETFEVTSVRIERAMDNAPRLFINECLVRRGEFYQDGKLMCRVGLGTDIG